MGKGRLDWGAGRVAVIERMEPIRIDLERGHTMKSIYARYEQEIGVGYSQFCRLLRRYAASSLLVLETRRPAIPTQYRRAAKQASIAQPTEVSVDGKPAPGTGFRHSGVTQPDEAERFFGRKK